MILPDYITPLQAWIPLTIDQNYQLISYFPKSVHHLEKQSYHVLGFRGWKNKKDIPAQHHDIKVIGKINLWGRITEYDESYITHRIALYPEIYVSFNKKIMEKIMSFILLSMSVIITYMLFSLIFSVFFGMVGLLALFLVFSRLSTINFKQQKNIIQNLENQGYICNK